MPDITIDTKTLDKFYSQLKAKNGVIAENEEYVRGANPTILRKAQEKKPDNRVTVALAKMAVEDMTGYAGGDIDVTYDLVSTETEDDNDPFIEYMRQMDAHNNEDLETSELYEESLVQGDSYELWWVSDEKEGEGGLLTAEYKIVPNSEILLIFDNSLKKKLLAAIHFLKSPKEKQIKADIYYPLHKDTWIKKDDTSVWVKEILTEKESQYPYATVPVIQFKSNRRVTPIFQAEKPLIDAHDELISKSLNEVDRFNAVITLLGSKLKPDFAKKLKEGLISIIDDIANAGEGDNWPRYLEKNLGGVNDFYNKLCDRLERLYHKSVKIPDMTDEAFAGQQSGIAIAFKLIGMEFKASQIETYFNQGLKQRLSLYGDVYNASTKNVDVSQYQANVRATRNLPIDVKAKAEIAQMLQGILSEETLLKIFPKTIVDDVKKEMERKKEQIPEIDLIGGDDSDDS